MVTKEASEVVHSRKFPDWCKTSRNHVRLLSKIKLTKFAAVELLNPNGKKSRIRSCALQIVTFLKKTCFRRKWNKLAAVEFLRQMVIKVLS